MEDCYKILGVSPKATIAEIKTAFRKKAKELHPDLSKQENLSTKAFQKLLKAYQILCDSYQRSIFDLERTAAKQRTEQKKSFDYREWLLQREDDESRSKLIFFDLLHNRENDAVAEFKRMMTSRINFSLARWFSREDFMDLGYILAEELIFRAEYYDAYLLLAQVIRMEYSYAYFRHFFPEVMALARNLLTRKIPGNIHDELALDALEDALDLGFTKKDNAFFLKLMSEAYDRIGDSHTAAMCLQKAILLDSSINVSEKLKRKYR